MLQQLVDGERAFAVSKILLTQLNCNFSISARYSVPPSRQERSATTGFRNAVDDLRSKSFHWPPPLRELLSAKMPDVAMEEVGCAVQLSAKRDIERTHGCMPSIS
jgi:hypothetical protein